MGVVGMGGVANGLALNVPLVNYLLLRCQTSHHILLTRIQYQFHWLLVAMGHLQRKAKPRFHPSALFQLVASSSSLPFCMLKREAVWTDIVWRFSL